jgi:protein-S-isoprenylcysteine O-methyltransferase Ste14
VCYLTCSYVVLPVLFRLRFGRWPYAYDLDRRDLYTAVDLAYGSALTLYTVVLLSGAPPKPVAALTGLATMSAGLSIQVLAVLAMGRSWRFGQDPNDESVEYVSRGPFRWFRHPIYTSLLIVAVGQGLLVGVDWRSSLLVATTLLHFVIQSQAEKRHWGWRGGRSP